MKIFTFALTTAIAGLLSLRATAQDTSLSFYIESNLPASAVRNITEAERVYCYTVEMPYENYQGYTIDQMAVTGFCGILNEQQANVIKSAFLQNDKSLSTKSAQCTIVPKVLIRFLRGIDSTDVLFSDPCPSLTFFFGGGMKSFNAEPVAAEIASVADLFEKSKIEFVSPALLDQLFPIGIAQTEAQKALVAKNKAPKPSTKWTRTSEQAPVTQEKSEPEPPAKTSGWNKININKK